MPFSLTIGPITFSTNKLPELKPAFQLGAEVDLGDGYKAGGKAGLDDLSEGLTLGADAHVGDSYKAGGKAGLLDGVSNGVKLGAEGFVGQSRKASAVAQVHRDGIGVGASASFYKEFASEGDSLVGMIQNVKTKPYLFEGCPYTYLVMKQIDLIVEYLPDFLAWVIEKCDLDIETCTWVEGTVEVSVGVGGGGIFQPGWADTSGYHMVGGGGSFVLAGFKGAAGANTDETKMKVTMTAGAGLVSVTVKAIVDL